VHGTYDKSNEGKDMVPPHFRSVCIILILGMPEFSKDSCTYFQLISSLAFIYALCSFQMHWRACF
jgi:hypothetical protein